MGLSFVAHGACRVNSDSVSFLIQNISLMSQTLPFSTVTKNKGEARSFYETHIEGCHEK
jgi:hypothetical protein